MLFRRHVWQKYRNGRDSGNGLPWYKSACNRDSAVESQHQHPHSGNVPVQTATRVLSAQDVSWRLFHNLTYLRRWEMLHGQKHSRDRRNHRAIFLGNARDEMKWMKNRALKCNFNVFFLNLDLILSKKWKFQGIATLKKNGKIFCEFLIRSIFSRRRSQEDR